LYAEVPNDLEYDDARQNQSVSGRRSLPETDWFSLLKVVLLLTFKTVAAGFVGRRDELG